MDDVTLYKLFYDIETSTFEGPLLEILETSTNILDIGCGVCKFWINNIDKLKDKYILCTDLNTKVLEYPRSVLGSRKNISIVSCDIKDMDLRYIDTVIFIEVVMQIDNPHELLKYIWSQNNKCKIVMGHTIFTPSISQFIGPFKQKIIKNIPIVNSVAGKALTMKDTEDIVSNADGKIYYNKNIRNNRYIFVCFSNDYYN